MSDDLNCKKKRVVAVNHTGRWIGEDHPNARLTNKEVDMLLDMREEGYAYKKLADIFEISKGAVRNICKGRARCQTPTRFKTLHNKPEGSE